MLRNCARRSKAGFFLVIAYTIEQKGLAAFGSIGILHIKALWKASFPERFYVQSVSITLCWKPFGTMNCKMGKLKFLVDCIFPKNAV